MATQIKQFQTVLLLAQPEPTTGSASVTCSVVTGSRMLIGLNILSIDPATTVTLTVGNTFATDDGYETILETSSSVAGRIKEILTDFHNLFQFTIAVTGGNATYKLAVSLSDNAMTTRIENASVDVNLRHTGGDSVQIGDGVDVLGINPDGSVNFVELPFPTEELLNVYGEQAAVVSGLETTLATYLVPPGKVAYLTFGNATGANAAQYFVKRNFDAIDSQQTYWGAFNAHFRFTDGRFRGLVFAAGETISLTVIHDRPEPADFAGKLLILIKDV